MKRTLIALLLVLSMVVLSGCSILDSAPIANSIPSRMVTQLHIFFYSEEEELAHVCNDQDQLTQILNLLRELDTDEIPEESPSLDEETPYWTITVTYADDSTRTYRLLEDENLLCADEKWCIVDSAKAAEFIDLIETTAEE